MDEIAEQMRSAVASPPPTRIDVDRLIAADRQRRRQRAWAAAGTGVALVAAVAVTPALLGGPAAGPGGFAAPPAGAGSPTVDASLCPVAEPAPSGPPAPQQSYDTVRDRPTERPDDGVARLTLVLRPALGAVVPAGLAIDGTIPGCDSVQFTYEKSHWHYYARAQLTRSGQADNLTVSLIPTAADEPVGCAAAPDPGSCTGSSRLPDGGTLAYGSSRPGKDGFEQRWAQVQRADGTTVLVTTDNHHVDGGTDGAPPTFRFGPPPVLTVAQLTAIATTGGLTLYP
ncbi:hypothetical protein ACGFIR_01935 [Micromonospora sp. NPDC049051]|uniref:hypothetical protein n=1 Tax=Micromonospora sp. NPDC049051 TaxID=3364264 RepID=UPI003723424D